MSAPEAAAKPEVHKGLEGVIASETTISEVDGKNCQLIYRGYHIDELVGRTTYEEVSYLLLFGALPARGQLADWTTQLEAHRTLEPEILAFLRSLPRRSSSMARLRSAISLLGVHDPDGDSDELDTMRRQSVRVIAKTVSLVATIARLEAGQEPLPPKRGLSQAATFLYLLHGREADALEVQALDAYFVLLAEHGLNASTFAARTVMGTKSDYYSAITAAIGTLKGPLHGAANSKAMEMLEEIGTPDNVVGYVQKTLADHKRFMGFGHRVYKGADPRAKHLRALAEQLGRAHQDLKWFDISTKLQEAVWQAKQLYINVDFYSASLLHYLNIPTPLFTAMFACARMAGWSANILEQASDNRLIRPLASYVGPRDLRFVPLDQRR